MRIAGLVLIQVRVEPLALRKPAVRDKEIEWAACGQDGCWSPTQQAISAEGEGPSWATLEGRPC